MKKLLLVLFCICTMQTFTQVQYLNKERSLVAWILMDDLGSPLLKANVEIINDTLVEYYSTINNINVIMVYANDVCIEHYFIYLDTINTSKDCRSVLQLVYNNINMAAPYSIEFYGNHWYEEKPTPPTFLGGLHKRYNNYVQTTEIIPPHIITDPNFPTTTTKSSKMKGKWTIFKRKYKLKISR